MNKQASEPKDLSDLAIDAELADYSPIKGCMIIKPYGYKIWELLQTELNKRIQAAGYDNAYFPMLIPSSFLQKESDHVEGFAPECALVTQAGNTELEDPLVLRPTSETMIYHMYSKWIKSWRDLPYGINQWANVIRWEKRTRLFLRTTEFLWQEGHTAHATPEEADQTALKMLNLYDDFIQEYLALYSITGEKSETERFAGAEKTYSLEMLMSDGKILQAGTSHYLGDGFSKAFNIQYQDKNNDLQYTYLTSWGVSTRLIGAIIMGHRDAKGLRLPPKVAPYQVVIIPITRKNQDSTTVINYCNQLFTELKEQSIRVHLDDTDNSPGYKFNQWELKGAPLRIQVGLRDIENNVVEIARRDTCTKLKDIPQDNLISYIQDLLQTIQLEMLENHKQFTSENIREANSLDEINNILDTQGGFVYIPWSNTIDSEKTLKEKTKATIRVKAFQDTETLSTNKYQCAIDGTETAYKYYAGRAY